MPVQETGFVLTITGGGDLMFLISFPQFNSQPHLELN